MGFERRVSRFAASLDYRPQRVRQLDDRSLDFRHHAGVLLGQQAQGERFSLITFMHQQTELCRVLVRGANLSWAKRYSAFVTPNPRTAKEGVAGYEIALNYTGLPFELIPRAASEINGKARFQLLSVNEAEQQQRPHADGVLDVHEDGGRGAAAADFLHHAAIGHLRKAAPADLARGGHPKHPQSRQTVN